MTTNNLNDIINNTAGNGSNVASVNNDPATIAVLNDLERVADRGWDASEYGVSAESIRARLAATESDPEARAELVAELVQRGQERANLTQSGDGRILTMVSYESGAPWHELGTLTLRDFSVTELKQLWKHSYDLENAFDRHGNAIPGVRYVEVSDAGEIMALAGVTFGDRATLSQPHDFIDWFASVVHSVDGARFASAGVIDDFKKSFISAQLPEVLEPIRGDETHHILFALDSADGTKAKSLFTSAYRPVCQNTVNLAESTGSRIFKARHTKNHDSRCADYLHEVERLRRQWTRLVDAAPAMVSTDSDIRTYAGDILNEVLGVTECEQNLSKLLEKSIEESDQVARARLLLSKRRGKVENALDVILDIHESETNTAKGKVWGDYQSVTEYATHHMGGRSDSDSARWRNMFGGGKSDETSQMALEQAIAAVAG